jgi:hypothetical protein
MPDPIAPVRRRASGIPPEPLASAPDTDHRRGTQMKCYYKAKVLAATNHRGKRVKIVNVTYNHSRSPILISWDYDYNSLGELMRTKGLAPMFEDGEWAYYEELI